MASSTHFSNLLWDLGFAAIRQQGARNLSLDVGYPRRFTLLLSPQPAICQGLLTQFRTDVENFGLILECVPPAEELNHWDSLADLGDNFKLFIRRRDTFKENVTLACEE